MTLAGNKCPIGELLLFLNINYLILKSPQPIRLSSKHYAFTDGEVKATGRISPAAKSRGKLCALRSCITSIPRSARLIISAHVLITRPSESTTD